jgi:hypothetical protein
MKIVVALLLLMPFNASHVTAQLRRQKAKPEAERAKAADAEAERILLRHVEALGDEESLRSVRSRVLRGVAEWSPLGITGKVDIYYKAPNKTLTVFEVPGRGQFIEAFDGRYGWLQTPFTGALDFNRCSLEAARRKSEGIYNLKVREAFSRLTLKGTRKLGQRETYVVEATPVAGLPQVLHFDTESGLLVRVDMVRESPGAQYIPSSVTFDDFATLDGVKIPTLIRQTFPDFTLSIRIYEMKHNTRLEDNLFDRPSGEPDSRSIVSPQ